jgi:hypothetical protein
MPGTSPVILILGAGPNIGQAVARTSTDNQLNITSDFDDVNAFTIKCAPRFPAEPHAQSWHQVEIQKPMNYPPTHVRETSHNQPRLEIFCQSDALC